MSYQVLARKWRPRNFREMVGQEHVLRALVNALEQGRLHHAYLFTGTRGVGKTTLARIFAKSLNCEQGVTAEPCGECSACTEIDAGRFVDLIEVDAASRTGVDDTRELLENVQYAPTRGRYKVYLIDEVHMFSRSSFNALLKTLEEPPPHVKFLLATTEPQKLPVTVLSRCLQFNLRHLPQGQIRDHLVRILEAEGVPAEPEAVQAIAEAAQGSMRDALSLLDQAIAFGDGRLRAEEVRAMLGTVDRGRIHALLEALADNDAATLLDVVEALASQAVDFGDVLAQLLTLLQRIAVFQAVGQVDLVEDPEARARIEALAGRLAPEDVQLWYQIGLMGRRDLPLAPDPRGGLEMILLRMLAFRPLSPGEANPRDGVGQAPSTAPREQAPARPTVQAAPGSPAAGGEAGVPPADWATLIERMGLRGMVRQLAEHCTLEALAPERVCLRLDGAYAQLHTPLLESRLQQALQACLGTRTQLVIEVGEVVDTPAKQRREAAARRRQQAREAIEKDPNINMMKTMFDAELEESSIQPLD
ncbi:MAG: DNA polymerase III subunit gamma/tau [Gammaproteobacteria bacterium]|nr:MAG: DNA polymerase III subunit gamma/tau [Gammaproteobacteria bacterium]